MYKYILVAIIALSIGFFIGQVNTALGVYESKSNDFGVYFTTTTDHTLRDGYSGSFRLDQYGQIILAN